MQCDHSHNGDTYDSAIRLLKANGQRVTEPRKAILRLLTCEHGPYSAEEVHKRMDAGVCDLVTVYRCLTALEEIGALRRCDFGDGIYRYEHNAGDHHHHHVICRHCRKVEVMEFCVADSLERFARQKGYTNVSHTLEVFGICPNCQKRSTAAAHEASGLISP
jgi:Fur family ferric uptake transcriptional regulator